MNPYDEPNHNTKWCLAWADIKRDQDLTAGNLLYLTQRYNIAQTEFEAHLANLMHYRSHQHEF